MTFCMGLAEFILALQGHCDCMLEVRIVTAVTLSQLSCHPPLLHVCLLESGPNAISCSQAGLSLAIVYHLTIVFRRVSVNVRLHIF